MHVVVDSTAPRRFCTLLSSAMHMHVIIKPRLRLLESRLFIVYYFTSENVASTVQAGFKLKNEEFRPEYQDLENGRTEKLINKIEGAVGIFTSNS